jgi:predicted dinucleotide-binding enzyme
VKKIVVIGTGRMGGAFATAFAKRTSHAVSIRGSHAGSSSTAALSRQLGVRVADDKELLAADVVFVASLRAALPKLHVLQRLKTKENNHDPQIAGVAPVAHSSFKHVDKCLEMRLCVN